MGKPKKENLARSMINPEFMAMDPSEMKDLDHDIDKLIKNAEADIKSAEWHKNDMYQQTDIFAEKGGDV